ncbi:MAG: glycosyltransferase [Solirubrobacterales bacterium]|nr:glycosyltransferase [Solirubrobacterales bacterium]
MARICVLRQFYVPDDPRVRREIYALTTAGHSVDIVCMRRPGEARTHREGSLTIHRLPMTHKRGGLARYAFEYVGFPALAGAYVAWLDRRRRFDLVQANTVPDWLVFASFAPRLRGVPVVLDLHECVPEFFATKLRLSLDHPAVRALGAAERASINFASAAITCTDQMRDAFVSRGAARNRIAVVMNSTDETIFDPDRFPPLPRREGRFSLICHGTIEERYGQDTIIRAMKRLQGRIPGLSLEIYGDGSYGAELRRLVDELGLQQEVTFHGFVPMDELVAAIADADAGVVAMKRDAFRDLTHCNKMFDLITMRRPVICSRTRSVMAYFPNGSLKYFDADDAADLARAIEELYLEPAQAEELVRSASAQNEPYRWPYQRVHYLAVIEDLLAGDSEPGDLALAELVAGPVA